jgi:hypothetical protein
MSYFQPPRRCARIAVALLDCPRRLKRGIMGTWHKISAKHLPAYLDEMTWRFNNRKNRYLFRDTLMQLVESKNLEYKQLVNEKEKPTAQMTL